MSFIKLCILACITMSSLSACASYEQAEIGNKSVSQIKDIDSFISSITPSNADVLIGQVTGIIEQDRMQQKITLVTKSGLLVNPISVSRMLIKCKNWQSVITSK